MTAPAIERYREAARRMYGKDGIVRVDRFSTISDFAESIGKGYWVEAWLFVPHDEVNKQRAPYGEWCRDPKLCAGKGYCEKDPTCGD